MTQPLEVGDRFSRTPIIKRLPTVESLILSFVLANVFGHSIFVGVGILVGTLVLCTLVLHCLFHQPLERLLQYREYERQ